MPFVNIRIYEGWGKERLNEIAKRVTAAITDVTQLPKEAVWVVFEEVDVPGLLTVDGIAEVEGNYPSAGVGERAAWFRDSEGNLLGLGQPIRQR